MTLVLLALASIAANLVLTWRTRRELARLRQARANLEGAAAQMRQLSGAQETLTARLRLALEDLDVDLGPAPGGHPPTAITRH